MALAPGEEASYCSVNPNLIGKVLIAATGRPLQDLFQDLIAGPLQLGRYHLILQPTGEPYMGGGIYWMPRDFMKLGQLMLNGGTWNGKRVVGEDWVERSSKAHYQLQERGYGYLWWVVDYPYKDGTVRAFFAGGNGGQTVIGIPELDLVIAFWGGNYSSRTLYRMSGDLVSDYILKGVGSK
jgi:CubicO group peptidase (beta-lactamase class C family)